MDAEKIICCDKGNNGWETAALMGGGFNNWMNNPFAYILILGMMRYMYGNDWQNNPAANAQFATLQSQMQDNQNSNLLMDAIKGNGAAIQALCSNLNCDMKALQQSLCDISNGITNLSGTIGFSTEKIINAGLMGDSQILSKLSECCCGINQNILNFKAENQLQNCQQTQAITAAINYDGNLTRQAIAEFRHAWEESRYTDVVAEKNRLQTVLDLKEQQQATGAMVAAAVNPVSAALGQVSQQVQTIASHQLPTYPQPYVPGYPYGVYGGTGTGFWG